ncbi:DNA-3-methyladenine glycosylase 2 family protein [Streptomyces sp. adm13(2018)]|uniref:bifunctional transcriptional activator/DNA repair enzyme AdaA n=1 Tax=Streptomyces sp. adm13(2018) TaxID=2479007 RepID=UPI0011CE4F57|nr:Ada metal-binding domain-containing protein [Streptomyces sp. adm13(2018)]TXS19309.1 DNA-3-methyladenine glycosylase 2 family protein [Streptomyces sp. adm13(2018)]
MHTDTERCVRAVQSKDARFDGVFFTAVRTTRIYCRPSCPVVPPKPENMEFHASAASCQRAGFRACKRCRPDTSPGSPEWNVRADAVARAVRLIQDGVVDREGVPGLARRLGWSTRQIERQLLAELGAGPLALARAQRAQTARILIETTPMPLGEIAFAAGFSSIRTFNDTIREVFARTPGELRALLDLDADPVAVDERLRADPLFAPLVDAAPGRRVPGTVDPAEFAVRAVLGQQVSTAAARTHAARLVTAHGTPVDDPEGGLTHLFPSPGALAALDPESLALPRSRRTTLLTLVRALADGSLTLGPADDREEARARLLALPGFGPWTTEIIAMRALGDPDAFLPGDLGVRRAAEGLGLPGTPAALTARAARWRPWRAYAVQYLWATDDHPINHLPSEGH